MLANVSVEARAQKLEESVRIGRLKVATNVIGAQRGILEDHLTGVIAVEFRHYLRQGCLVESELSLRPGGGGRKVCGNRVR
jgi:hypothetical protein